MSIDRNVSKAGRKVSSLTFGSQKGMTRNTIYISQKRVGVSYFPGRHLSLVNNLVVKNEFFSWASSTT